MKKINEIPFSIEYDATLEEKEFWSHLDKAEVEKITNILLQKPRN